MYVVSGLSRVPRTSLIVYLGWNGIGLSRVFLLPMLYSIGLQKKPGYVQGSIHKLIFCVFKLIPIENIKVGN